MAVRWRVATAAVAAVVVALLAWGLWWWTHPTLFTDQGITGTASPAPVDKAVLWVEVAMGPDQPSQGETITLHSITAHFKVNSAHASAKFAICHSKDTSSISSLATGDTPDKYCSQLVPVRDGLKYALRDAGEGEKPVYILMAVTPTTPGKAHVDWVTFDYTRSWSHLHQHGKDRSKQDWILTAT